ncbi:MAG: GNAT family N-acetyltransferase [Actinomycetota bacterium]|nr:GNAT family N-acetyltransferase [Actinomycetota bacterium]
MRRVATMDPHVIESPRLHLVLFTKRHMESLLGRARADAPFDVPPGWAAEEDWLLDYRVRQIETDPAVERWLLRGILWTGGSREMIGHAGFHGRPDERGYVEIGYTVFPGFRRKGIAHEAAVALFGWAQAHPEVRGFRASVSPENEPSLQLVAKLGFAQTGVQWDERDGKELVFERPAPFG